MKPWLGNEDIVIKVLNHENILINIFVSDTCLPIYLQTLNFWRHKWRHLFDLNFGDSNVENKALENQGCFYWKFMCDKDVRGESGSLTILRMLGFVLGGRFENEDNQWNTMLHSFSCNAIRK